MDSNMIKGTPASGTVGSHAGKRMPSVNYPERLREGADAQEDVTAAHNGPAQYMNQSVFSMIAAAGSKVDFHARFDEGSSESEDEQLRPPRPTTSLKVKHTLHHDKQQERHDHDNEPKLPSDTDLDRRTKKFSALPKLEVGRSHEEDHMSESTILSTKKSLPDVRRDSHMSSRPSELLTRHNLQNRAMSAISTSDHDEKADASQRPVEAEVTREIRKLDISLKEIFGFEDAEEVIADYPCWFLQSVLLQGYMYITQCHICFYAYLPKKSNKIVKSGLMSKRGRTSTKYKRYWFALKGDVLSYYRDQSDRYFPSGNIDLRYGISASLAHHKDGSKDVRDFSIVTNQRTYHFRADSTTSAKEWVKILQKVIFRSRNDGDSVKISLPVENIIDLEESPVVEFADTFKIRVVDNEETYAIDEYFFSFFSLGKDALRLLHTVIDGSAARPVHAALLSSRCGEAVSPAHDVPRSREVEKRSRSRPESPRDGSAPILRDQVRATLTPTSPTGGASPSPRRSAERGRTSLDTGRRSVDNGVRNYSRSSFERGRQSLSSSHSRQVSSAASDRSPVLEQLPGKDSPNEFPASAIGRTGGRNHISEKGTQGLSGSQILQRSDVFDSPPSPRDNVSPLERPQSCRTVSNDTLSANELALDIHVQPPTREQTRQIPPEATTESHDKPRPPPSPSPTLNQLVKVSGYPLQKAAGFAGFLRTRSKRMSSAFASESMGYVGKVSGMWTGGHRHYGQNPMDPLHDTNSDLDEECDEQSHQQRFHAHFALSPSEKLEATYFGYLHRVLPLYGKVYVSNENFCFRSLLPGTKTKLVLPLKDIENVSKEKGFRFGYSGLVLVIRGHEELFFEFSQIGARDDCAVQVHQSLGARGDSLANESSVQALERQEELAKAEHKALQEARQVGSIADGRRSTQDVSHVGNAQDMTTILFDDPRVSILNFKPAEPLRITCLTIGSRGDVQPYIALCKRLADEGHKPKIATHVEFEAWIRGHGIDFSPVDGDPAELMRICVENGMFTYSFLREASLKFRSWIDELLISAWKACQDAEVLIESPSAMAGIHIAEALSIPYFRAFTMPWTRTRAYPHAFAVPERKMGGAYNYMTYVMFDNVFWKAIAGQVNRWRKKDLGLRSTNLDKMQPNKVPFLYNFSPAVVIPPLDYSDWIRVTGYWFLDEATDWTPPADLINFIAKARADDKKIVYIGFGSIVVSDPEALTKTVIDSVLKADVRVILSKGWSDRLGNKDATVAEVALPSEILQIKSAPHDWLFKQIDAAAHHGGAGTTGASLRAGLPTIIKPFFGDQFFFGSRVEDLGVGLCMKKLNVSVFSRALWEATHSQRMIVRARGLGQQIREEDGVGNAVQAIYRDLDYARSLIKRRKDHLNQSDDPDIEEENWTFIGEESDQWEPSDLEGARLHGRQSIEMRRKTSLDLGA